MCAIPARWGFSSKGDRQRFEKLLARLRRWGYLPYDFPALKPWLMRLIESCSDLSPNANLMYCVTFSKRIQPPYAPLEIVRITLSYLLKRTGILFRGIIPCCLPHDRVSLVLRLQERL